MYRLAIPFCILIFPSLCLCQVAFDDIFVDTIEAYLFLFLSSSNLLSTEGTDRKSYYDCTLVSVHMALFEESLRRKYHKIFVANFWITFWTLMFRDCFKKALKK